MKNFDDTKRVKDSRMKELKERRTARISRTNERQNGCRFQEQENA